MKNRNQDLIILLTATITPNTYSKLKVTEPKIRKQQYLEALNFYIHQTNYKIVFAENSGDQLAEFPLLPERIEYLSFKSEPIQPDRGKAFKELEIIDFAIQNSTFIKEAKAIAKIAGRLQVLNFKKLSRTFLKYRKKQNHLVYANSYKQGNMDSRCFFFTLDFWPYQLEVGQNITLLYNFELSLWDSIHQYNKIEGKTFKPFYIPLRIRGVSGFSGNKYKHNLLIHYARLIRNLSQVFPSKS
ncbi:hypothetical protein LZ575_08420 [Antarcticibacterium sp. 1MA-6-2]|uniref:hypothetical protein n=1 Tax=Antarcticibacterium sp. 1MA-6-2 TaxID=2908210 RepID=UPI001F3E8103|nr:hypothetical protein [Antarcticibacterium sp. 1MA-6-2]UJH92497.1 hypothetical protein LZ575_08420 [Antarcticibacterium sp. 1MA-6-2]